METNNAGITLLPMMALRGIRKRMATEAKCSFDV
jgi:hypothetical protein